ncbi:MAG: HD-GYP domain-containing protein [bacterium]
MRRVITLELVGQEVLSYDLFDEEGNVVYTSGDQLTPNLLMMLNFKKIYRKDEPLPEKKDAILDLIQDDHVITEKSIQQSDRKKSFKKSELKSAISSKATEYLIKSTKNILQDITDGKTPDVSACSAVRDIVLNEVSEKLEKIECIGQLRVFDEYTFSHTINVSTISSAIALTMKMSEKEIEDLSLGALLHDIGKMRIPIEILNKPGKLEPEEFDIMKSHTVHGYKIITNEMYLPEKIAKVALEHQEKYGGTGYPNKLKGKEISVFAQIASIADVFDALVSKRVYKQPMPQHEALKIMLSEGSASFNPFMLYKFVYLANYKDASSLLVEEE